MEKLFSKPPSDWTADDLKAAVDIYKMAVDMADKVSQRRQSANSFYLSVNTGLIGASAYISSFSKASHPRTGAIAFAGALICSVWWRNIQSYRDLNKGKFEVIQEMEKALPLAPYQAEWEFLERGKNREKYRPFYEVEILVPIIFGCVHIWQVAVPFFPG